MQRWLAARGESVSMAPPEWRTWTFAPTMALMPGMLTPEQMKALRKAKGAEFDHLFLTGMIQHHNGALTMVKDLFDTAGAGQDAEIFDFATDADNTQRARSGLCSLCWRKTRRERNDEPSAQCCFASSRGRDCFVFRCDGCGRRRLCPQHRASTRAGAEEEAEKDPFAWSRLSRCRRDDGVGCERSSLQASAGAV